MKIAVIGAGINGAMTAFLLHQKGCDVTVFEQEAIAAGGSGAAGAFLSPKFSKSGELKTLINTALDEAFRFYQNSFPQLISFYPLLHIAKDAKDAKNLSYIKQHDNIPLLHNPPFDIKEEYIYTSKSAIVQAKAMVRALLEDIEVCLEKIFQVQKQKDGYLLNKKYRFDKVVLAYGAYNSLVEEKYLKNVIRGIWGHRIDIVTSTQIPCSIHQFVSISPTSNEKKSAIGATHDVHFHPENNLSYDFEKGRKELLEKATRSVALQDVKVLKDYVGLRSGSSDYLPLIGEVVDMEATLSVLSRREIEAKKQDFNKYIYHKGLYSINGSAGYGFVLAPYLAMQLVANILEEKAIDPSLAIARFFPRYARKNL